MSTLVYMKMLEQTPAKYDRGMRILTLGRIDKVKREIADRWIQPGARVLEIGCGTGSLAALMIQRGADVTGIDISEPMLAQARHNAPEAKFVHLTAMELGRFEECAFDTVVSTLTFSELTEAERSYALEGIRRVLKPDGRLVIADEVRPMGWWRKTIAYTIRWPLAALTFAVTQNTTHALSSGTDLLQSAGYRIVEAKFFLGDKLALVVAENA